MNLQDLGNIAQAVGAATVVAGAIFALVQFIEYKKQRQDAVAAEVMRTFIGAELARALTILRGIFGRTYRERMQEMSWSNLPILNEWKRLYPDQDPVKVHQRLWQVRLVDPAGGAYVWNEQYQTMESTKYGHPGAPKEGPGLR
mgnify:CR=1 FL=1